MIDRNNAREYDVQIQDNNMCMRTNNPFKRMATSDITCYKIAKIYARTLRQYKPVLDGGIPVGEMCVISSGHSTAFCESSYDLINRESADGFVKHDIVYVSPYNTFVLPAFGKDAEHQGIISNIPDGSWNLFKREVTRGYHSFANKDDALEHLYKLSGYVDNIFDSYNIDKLGAKINWFDIIECVIPRGKIYMTGKFNDLRYPNYVSSSFRPVRSLGLAGEINYINKSALEESL